MKKFINQITFSFVEERPGRDSEDIKKECNVNCFDFFFFSVFLMDVMGGKITTSENCTKLQKEETHAQQKRARSVLSGERMLELRQWCNTSWECSVRRNRGRKVTHRKTNHHKMRPYCTIMVHTLVLIPFNKRPPCFIQYRSLSGRHLWASSWYFGIAKVS